MAESIAVLAESYSLNPDDSDDLYDDIKFSWSDLNEDSLNKPGFDDLSLLILSLNASYADPDAKYRCCC